MQGRNFVVKIYEPALNGQKIEGVTWHTLRHTFASRLLDGGSRYPDRPGTAGHSTITMTMRYAHLSPAHLRTAVNRASLGAIASKKWSGTGSKTGRRDNQQVEQGPVRITETSEISAGMVGVCRAGSNRRIAVYQTAPLATWVRRHGSDYREEELNREEQRNRGIFHNTAAERIPADYGLLGSTGNVANDGGMFIRRMAHQFPTFFGLSVRRPVCA